MLILLPFLSIAAGKRSRIDGVGIGSVDAERKFILTPIICSMVLIQEFTQSVACLKNRDLLGRFEGSIWHVDLL